MKLIITISSFLLLIFGCKSGGKIKENLIKGKWYFKDESGLMTLEINRRDIKSISNFVGIGKNVRYLKYSIKNDTLFISDHTGTSIHKITKLTSKELILRPFKVEVSPEVIDIAIFTRISTNEF